MMQPKKNGLNLEGSICQAVLYGWRAQLVGNHPFPSKKTGWKCLEFQVNLIS